MAANHEMMELCPLSGIGRPPSEWSHCRTQCSWIDPDSCECAATGIVEGLQDLTAMLAPYLHSGMRDATKCDTPMG